jgi:hypothetical protein
MTSKNRLFESCRDLRVGCTKEVAISLIGEEEFNTLLNTKQIEKEGGLYWSVSVGMVSAKNYLDLNTKTLDYLKVDSRLN